MINSKLPPEWYRMNPDDRERWLAAYITDSSIELERMQKDITSLMKVSVDGVNKTLYFKTIIGILDSDIQTIVAHGLTLSKILYTKTSAYNSFDSSWYSFEDVDELYTSYDDTSIKFLVPDVNFQGQAYKVTIVYHS